MDTSAPVVEMHDGIMVVRDDLIEGGTKARYSDELFRDTEHLVYASPAQGGGQIALAVSAQRLRKRLSIFVAAREQMHPRTRAARERGAEVFEVDPGYLTVVQARARQYANDKGATLAPFGLRIPEAMYCIAAVCHDLNLRPDEVWCSAGSGTLASGLRLGFPNSIVTAVSVGHKLVTADVSGALIMIYPKPYNYRPKERPPFDADPHYEAKAWQFCKQHRGPGAVLFWNVMGEQ